jgi:AraC-like DNA-binding protein
MPIARQSAQAIIEALEARGLGLRRLGIRRVASDEDLHQLWLRAIARSRRALPLELGLSLPFGAMGVVDYLAASSASLGAALAVTQQVFPLVAPEVQLQMERLRDRSWRVRIVNQPSFPGEAESDLVVLGTLLSRVRKLASRSLQIPLVELKERDDPSWSRLLATRVRCRCRTTAVHFSAADWTVPIRSADERLLSMLRQMVGADQRSADALLVAVRALARDRLPELLTLDHAAPTLGLSRRTLQRRLSERKTSISQLCDRARRDLAEELMHEGLFTLGEVAHKVGFAEQASFTRAWTRWFGTAPSRRRRPRKR